VIWRTAGRGGFRCIIPALFPTHTGSVHRLSGPPGCRGGGGGRKMKLGCVPRERNWRVYAVSCVSFFFCPHQVCVCVCVFERERWIDAQEMGCSEISSWFSRPFASFFSFKPHNPPGNKECFWRPFVESLSSPCWKC
jgi:hypothetical protein